MFNPQIFENRVLQTIEHDYNVRRSIESIVDASCEELESSLTEKLSKKFEEFKKSITHIIEDPVYTLRKKVTEFTLRSRN